jgi:hypothetical protein
MGSSPEGRTGMAEEAHSRQNTVRKEENTARKREKEE